MYLFLVTLTSTSMLFSSFLDPKKSISVSLVFFIIFYIIGVYWDLFTEDIEEIKYISIFFYYQTGDLLIDHIWEDIWWNMLVLGGYSFISLLISIIIFNKREIPV